MAVVPAFAIVVVVLLTVLFLLLLFLAVKYWNHVENTDWDAQQGRSGLYTVDEKLTVPWWKLYAFDMFHMVDKFVPPTSLLKPALVPGRAAIDGCGQMVDQNSPDAAVLCPQLAVPAGCECVVVLPQSNVGVLAGGGVDVKVKSLRGQQILRVLVEQCPVGGDVEENVARCSGLGRRRLKLCSYDSDDALAFLEEVGSYPPSYEVQSCEGEYFASISAGLVTEGGDKKYVTQMVRDFLEMPSLLKLSGDMIMSNVSVTDVDRGCFCWSKCKKGKRYLAVVAGADVGLLVLLFLAVELMERSDGARGPARGAFDLESTGKTCPGCGLVYAERDVCCVRCGRQRELSRGMSTSSGLADLVGLNPRSVILEIQNEVIDLDSHGARDGAPIDNRDGFNAWPLCYGCSGCGDLSAERSVCCGRCGRQRSAESAGLAELVAIAERHAVCGPKAEGRGTSDTSTADDLMSTRPQSSISATSMELEEQTMTEVKGNGWDGQKVDGRGMSVISTVLDGMISPRPQSCTSAVSTEPTTESGSGSSSATSVGTLELITPRQRWVSGTSSNSFGLAPLQVPAPRWVTEDVLLDV